MSALLRLTLFAIATGVVSGLVAAVLVSRLLAWGWV